MNNEGMNDENRRKTESKFSPSWGTTNQPSCFFIKYHSVNFFNNYNVLFHSIGFWWTPGFLKKNIRGDSEPVTPVVGGKSNRRTKQGCIWIGGAKPDGNRMGGRLGDLSCLVFLPDLPTFRSNCLFIWRRRIHYCGEQGRVHQAFPWAISKRVTPKWSLPGVFSSQRVPCLRGLNNQCLFSSQQLPAMLWTTHQGVA